MRCVLAGKMCSCALSGLRISILKLNINLKIVPPDGQVHVSAPLGTRVQTIEAFIGEKRAWIEKHQNRLRAQKPQPRLSFEEAETHQLWGQNYCLRLRETNRRPHVALQGDDIVMYVRATTTQEQRRELLEAWYRTQIKEKATPMMADWAARMNVSPRGLYVQKMKTRWGSCNIRRATIRLNSELARKPLALLEYVVVHELVHLFERYHNARFYRLMDEFLPDWTLKRQALNYPERVDMTEFLMADETKA
jgi:predicted metal-dependent hydrolase